MKDKAFIGIDNGKHGAIAIITLDKTILTMIKYQESNTLLFYETLKAYQEKYDLYAFIEKPIVVYGLAHQTSPFETIGRHKMTLEILNIPYKIGDPAATSSNNWKKIIGLFDDAKQASTKNSKELKDMNKKVKDIKIQAELLGFSEKELLGDKIAYMTTELAQLAMEYRECKKKVANLKKDKKQSVKQTSVDACLETFPEAEKYILKSSRALKNKYDDDLAEALLLAECGRTLHINEKL